MRGAMSHNKPYRTTPMARGHGARLRGLAHPTTSAKEDQQALWMGSFLKPGKTSHTRATYFKPEGASSTFYPPKVNANLVELSNGPLKDKHAIPLTDKDTEVAEAFGRESSALHSHLLWLTDLLVVLNDRMVDPQNIPTIQPMIAQVLEHQRWVQALALLSDSLAISTMNAMLVRRVLTLSTLGGQVPKETLRNMRSSPLLGDLMFHLSLEDISSVQKRRNERYMFQVLKQAAHGPQPTLHEAPKPQGTSKQGFFRALSSTQVPKPLSRSAEVPSTQ